MSEKISDLLERAAARTVPVVRGIEDEQLSWPTPCGDYDVRTLAGHLYRVVVNFRELAAKRDSDFSQQSMPLEGDWRTGFAEATRRLVEAWAEPGAEEGTTGARAMPARTVGCMVLGDLVVHGWDLARATGLPYAPSGVDATLLDELGPQWAQLAPTGRKMGVFGPEFPVAPGAGRFERLLGLTGRDPEWTREARAGA
ncbi:TIGR03086 family metal-binding protein [Streptomyces montanisoli]|uniref:TIGR03086 family protein n=1 Tax=Streptomyces montanisoli TaxID=2798581 RepID=A0A940M943_9ACTN|nr:TIGR03086 family metal-binding protein [Streptomyces montanisoli]MBP0456628.1 TIGR03086 family protein [Streptomyces montanisoli]